MEYENVINLSRKLKCHIGLGKTVFFTIGQGYNTLILRDIKEVNQLHQAIEKLTNRESKFSVTKSGAIAYSYKDSRGNGHLDLLNAQELIEYSTPIQKVPDEFLDLEKLIPTIHALGEIVKKPSCKCKTKKKVAYLSENANNKEIISKINEIIKSIN